MSAVKVGFLHPGEMGVSLAAAVQRAGHTALWTSAGRSPQTRRRAEARGLRDAGTLSSLCTACEVIVSICPPHAADSVADDVLACGYRGIYVDANAISPRRTMRMGGRLQGAGAAFVDGGVIGGPAWEAGETCLYLAGEEAERVAALFSSGPLEAVALGTDIGRASALKMCYAAYSKGSTALVCAVLGAAESLGVRQALEAEWLRGGPQYAEEARLRARRVTRKAWRFEGEMHEIASTFAEAGFPQGFHLAAAEVFRRLAPLKSMPDLPNLETVLTALQVAPD